ncbi:acyltransferase [Lysinimonas soli]|uniref:Acyltransferase n=1 Tax=Lysinimonas soli TaxID=1074233 RepID=A0ABW0NNB1_9MICO
MTPTPGIDVTKRDPTLDLARVFCVLLVVAIHLLEVGVGTGPRGLVVSRPLEHQPWFDAATWVLQIMPLFFVVGGFAGSTAWRRMQTRGEPGAAMTEREGGLAASYAASRVLRLAEPALPLFVFFAVVVGAATLIGVDPALLDTVTLGAGSPLWFLAAYGLSQVLVPVASGWHARAPRLTVLLLLAGAIVVDLLRYRTGIVEIGLVNLFFVWMLIQQFGFWYADGRFAARRWWQLAILGIVSWATLIPLTLWGPYSPDMLNKPEPAHAASRGARALAGVRAAAAAARPGRAHTHEGGIRHGPIGGIPAHDDLPLAPADHHRALGPGPADAGCEPRARDCELVVAADPVLPPRDRPAFGAVEAHRALGDPARSEPDSPGSGRHRRGRPDHRAPSARDRVPLRPDARDPRGGVLLDRPAAAGSTPGAPACGPCGSCTRGNEHLGWRA